MEESTRVRRRPAEVRELLVEAATRVFKEKGFAQATTDDIAAEAGVAVSVMYRHFRNKSELFREAVVEPFLTSVRDFAATWQAQRDAPWDPFPLMRALLAYFYDSFVGHRDAVLGVAAVNGALDPDAGAEISEMLNQVFYQLRLIGESESARLGWFPPEDVELTVRLVIGMVMSAAVFDELILPRPGRSDRPDRDRLLDHLSTLALYGLRRAPGPDQT